MKETAGRRELRIADRRLPDANSILVLADDILADGLSQWAKVLLVSLPSTERGLVDGAPHLLGTGGAHRPNVLVKYKTRLVER